MENFSLEEQQWVAFTEMLAKFGMITVLGMILTPVPQFLFCGLTQKEKEARMASFSFSFLLLSLLNNLLWLAYSQKIGDENIGIPAMVGTLVGVFLIVVFQMVKSSRNQIIACFILVSISEIFFSSLVPAFLAGCTASFLSISTYFSTLGQIPAVIREKDARYINLPIVVVSIINATVWTAYAVLKKDIPLFMTNLFAFTSMSINMLFYLWACDLVSTSSIQGLISFFEILFPQESEKDQHDLEEGGTSDRQLDYESEFDTQRIKAEAQARFVNKQRSYGGFDAQSSAARATEDTRLSTCQSGSGSVSQRQSNNPFYYTGSQFDPYEEQKEFDVVNNTIYSLNSQRNGIETATNASRDHLSDHFIDDSVIEFVLKEDESGSAKKLQLKENATESAKYEDAQSGSEQATSQSCQSRDQKLLSSGEKSNGSYFDMTMNETKASFMEAADQVIEEQL